MYTKKYKTKQRVSPNNRRNSAGNKKAEAIDVSKYINEGKREEAPKPYTAKHGFNDFNLDKRLLSLIGKKGYKHPSEIQDKAIPHILNREDLIGVAGTGTGKTSAFLIPLVQRLISNNRLNTALILTPTRELANQINEEFESLTHGLDLHSTILIGGTSVKQSIRSLQKKNHIIIGTPGRIQDMAQQRALHYDSFKVLVLDEFDRMLDMGFSKEVQKINRAMKHKEQALLFSATLDRSQKHLIDEIVARPTVIKSSYHTHKSDAINQEVIETAGKDKFEVLTKILDQPENKKIILFCETKRKADRMAKKLKKIHFAVDAIHGDKSQNQRERILESFKSGKIDIIVATDVLARGIDVDNVSVVINYQPPKNYADYVHRIGRTGRAGKIGRAITLV